MANLTEEMSDTRAQLQRTDVSLQATKTRLRTTQTELQAARDSLQTTQDAVQTMRNALQATQDDLKATRKDLEEETEASKAAKKQLDVAENEIRILRARVDSLELIRPRTPQEMEGTFFNPDVGESKHILHFFPTIGHRGCRKIEVPAAENPQLSKVLFKAQGR